MLIIAEGADSDMPRGHQTAALPAADRPSRPKSALRAWPVGAVEFRDRTGSAVLSLRCGSAWVPAWYGTS